MTNTPDRLVPIEEVCRATSLARSSIYDLIKHRVFPPPVKIGNRSRWSEAVVIAWIERKKTATAV